MATTSTVRMKFDDAGCTIDSSGGNAFTLRDAVGNQVTISLTALLRCLAVAEHEKLVPALPGEFWQRFEQSK